jgi:hypothetical protein
VEITKLAEARKKVEGPMKGPPERQCSPQLKRIGPRRASAPLRNWTNTSRQAARKRPRMRKGAHRRRVEQEGWIETQTRAAADRKSARRRARGALETARSALKRRKARVSAERRAAAEPARPEAKRAELEEA